MKREEINDISGCKNVIKIWRREILQQEENSASGSCGDLFADVMTETANAGTSKSAAMAVNSTDQAAAVNSTDAADAGRGTRNGATPKGTAVGIKRERLHLRREEGHQPSCGKRFRQMFLQRLRHCARMSPT